MVPSELGSLLDSQREPPGTHSHLGFVVFLAQQAVLDPPKDALETSAAFLRSQLLPRKAALENLLRLGTLGLEHQKRHAQLLNPPSSP